MPHGRLWLHLTVPYLPVGALGWPVANEDVVVVLPGRVEHLGTALRGLDVQKNGNRIEMEKRRREREGRRARKREMDREREREKERGQEREREMGERRS